VTAFTWMRIVVAFHDDFLGI